MAAGHRAGVSGTAALHEAASAFVTGADRAVLAGVIAAAAGAVIAFRAFRPVRPVEPTRSVGSEAAEVPIEVAAGV